MSSFRTTITVPQQLKDRMDAVQVDVNWSAVAARAFEQQLAEIDGKKEERGMSDFIRVLGPGPDSRNKRDKSYQYIHRGTVARIIPVHAVEKDGRFFSCTSNFKDAKLISYRLIDLSGVEYSCGDPKELERLGLFHDEKKGRIGFAVQGSEKLEWQLVEEPK